MNFYRIGEHLCASLYEYNNLREVTQNEALNHHGRIFYLGQGEPGKTRRSFCLSNPDLIDNQSEGPRLLTVIQNQDSNIPKWLSQKIDKREVTWVNTNYPNWQDVLDYKRPYKWRVNIAGLGDVGGTLAVGLKLLAWDCISQIGIFDLDINKTSRWKYELGQIHCSSRGEIYPEIKVLNEDDLFDCDMFVFCVSLGVPPLTEIKQDVRMLQFEGNSKIVNHYARLARLNNFKGIFSVVSDPVELLCKSAFLSSNTNKEGTVDFMGLAPEQIRGYGLGVMHARAVFYSNEVDAYRGYLKEGRAFGQHGQGLIIANSIENYDEEISLRLTEAVKHANIDVRKTGFKPYIAPALSSGALSLIDTIKENWHYSSTFIGGVYFGARNRLLKSGTELETLELPNNLLVRINEEFVKLGEVI